jgi:hypothetical protein
LNVGPKVVLYVELCQSSLQLLLRHVEFAAAVQTKEELQDGHPLVLKLLHEFPCGLKLSVSFLTELSQPPF